MVEKVYETIHWWQMLAEAIHRENRLELNGFCVGDDGGDHDDDDEKTDNILFPNSLKLPQGYDDGNHLKLMNIDE